MSDTIIAIVIVAIAALYCLSKAFDNPPGAVRWALIVCAVLVVIVGIVIIAQPSADSGSRKCTICGKKADTTFQGSGYCTKHYKDAIIWTAEKTWD